jgi:hypothetical protein
MKDEMKNTNEGNFYSTIIAASAGIIGAILGIMANAFFKYLDNKDKLEINKQIVEILKIFYLLFLLMQTDMYKKNYCHTIKIK